MSGRLQGRGANIAMIHPMYFPSTPYDFSARDKTIFQFHRYTTPAVDPTEIASANKQFKKDLGVRIRTDKYANEYNCHGLTFAARLGWFFDVRGILKAHGYRMVGSYANFELDKIKQNTDIQRGDIIVYYDGVSDNVTHTGIVWSKRKNSSTNLRLTILSKWGPLSEYFHGHDKVPDNYGKSFEIWTDRT